MSVRSLLFESPTTLYRFFGDGGALLYVGITVNFDQRREQHSKDKKWWSEVKRWTATEHPCRMDAIGAEAEAIQSELPKYNYVHHPDPLPFEERGIKRRVTNSSTKKISDPMEALNARLDWIAERYNIPAEHAEVMRREALIDLEMGTSRPTPMPRIATHAEYQHALAMQAKRRARQGGA